MFCIKSITLWWVFINFDVYSLGEEDTADRDARREGPVGANTNVPPEKMFFFNGLDF